MEMVENQTLDENEHKMILDAEFVRDILFVYANESDWPSKIGSKELQQHFPKRPEGEIIFHLVRCQEAGLLDSKITRDQKYQPDGYLFCRVH